jgi:hypothetical protein
VYSWPAPVLLLRASRGPLFGSSLSFDGQYLVVGRMLAQASAQASGTSTLFYTPSDLQQATAQGSTLFCVTVSPLCPTGEVQERLPLGMAIAPNPCTSPYFMAYVTLSLANVWFTAHDKSPSDHLLTRMM